MSAENDHAGAGEEEDATELQFPKGINLFNCSFSQPQATLGKLCEILDFLWTKVPKLSLSFDISFFLYPKSDFDVNTLYFFILI